jgi:hypothetical protein
MPTTETAAHDAIMTHFFSEFQDLALEANDSEEVEVFWPNGEKDGPPNVEQPWVRFSLSDNLGSQIALGTGGTRRFEQVGIIIIQLFAPIGQGVTKIRSLSSIATGIFRGRRTSDDEVTFLNVRAEDVGPSSGWYQRNVVVEYSYDLLV